MKTLTFGDIHGLPAWKKVNPAEFDVIIFLGDYVDSYSVEEEAILENLQEIVSLKNRFP